jgi:hypothetical protein
LDIHWPLKNPAGGNGYRPHIPQRDFLVRARKRKQFVGKGIQRTNYFGGRGCAKTTTMVMDMFGVAMECPRMRTFWSAPITSDIDRVLLKELDFIFENHPGIFKVVNGQNGYRFIRWINGHETDLISRHIKNKNAKVALGGNYIGGWHDEPAYGYDQKKMNDIQAAIRNKRGPYRFVTMGGTPMMNGLYTYANMVECENFYATSFDNPHIEHSDIESWRASMSDDAWDQEVLGRWVQQGGRIWKNFLEKPWPHGNIIEGMEFNPENGWVLSCDVGPASSAFQVVQFIDPIHERKRIFKGKLPVVVGELVCNDMLLTEATDAVIREYCHGDPDAYGPDFVCIGSDVNSRQTDAPPVSRKFSNLGWSYKWPRNARLKSKEIQRQVLESLICNSAGERRMAVAANKDSHGVYQIAKQSFGRGKTRGILNVMRNDTFPEQGSAGVFRKDKAQAGVNAIEDDRDATLYWSTIIYPPEWGKVMRKAA